jgi:hypothetical protein
MEFEIQFSDITLLEANGNYEKVCKIMAADAEELGVASHKGEWMVRSKVTIMSPFGFAILICHFYNTGKVYVAEYLPSSKDAHNADIKSLTYWCNEFGWKTPEPLPHVVDSWPAFWKSEWETYIVDSEYLDKKYGYRKEISFDKDDNDDDENDDIVLDEDEQ